MRAQTAIFTGVPAAEIYDWLLRAYELAEIADDIIRKHSLLNKFGYWRVARGLGEFDQAEQDYRQAAEWSRQRGNREHERNLWSNLGVVYTLKGDYRAAFDAFDAALETSSTSKIHFRYWVTRHYLSAGLMQMGLMQRAHHHLAEATAQLCEMSNRNFEIKSRCDLGLCHHLSGQQELALVELNRVLELVAASGDLRYEAFTRTHLGNVYEAIGHHEDAKPMYEFGRKMHDQMGQHYYALNALAGTARVADLQGDGATAYAHVQTIWKTIGGKEMDATIETARTLRTCYTIFGSHDDPRAADVLDMALTQLRFRVSTIDDPEHVEQFWRVADHHFFRSVVEWG